MVLYALIPAKWRPYAKTVVAAIGTILAALMVALPDVPAWVPIALNLLTALGVWGVPNEDADGDGIPDDVDPSPRGGRHAA